MKFIILFICVPLVYSELHWLNTTYTAINGQTTAGIPEFSTVTTLDGHQIDYYDRNIKKMIPKQDWVKEFTSTELWKKFIKIRENLLEIYKNNIHVLMVTFNQSQGLHTYQRMYGCKYDDETEYSQVFDEYGYDGEDFISLDLKENRYIAPVPQASPTVKKWNNDREQLEFLKRYYSYDCVHLLKEFLNLSKATDPPKVSLLEKNPDYYTCHVTGFLFRDTSISWRKNGQALSDSSNLTSRDTLPNGDGTFQRRVILYVLPDEWREDQYTCVVEHKSLTEPIQKSMTVKKTKSLTLQSASDASNIIYLVIVIILVIVGLIGGLFGGLFGLWKRRKEFKYCSEKKTIYVRSKPSQEPASSQDSLLPTPSDECFLPEMNKITFQNLHLHSSSPVDRSSQTCPTTESFYKDI